MKSSILAVALSCASALALPLTEADNQQAPPAAPFVVSRFDAPTAEGLANGWLFSPPGSNKNAMLKFYQNNSLMTGRKGSAWVIEFAEDVDAKQIQQLANVRNAFIEPANPATRPYAVAQPYALPQRQPQLLAVNPAAPMSPAAPANVQLPAGPAVSTAIQAAAAPAIAAALLAPAGQLGAAQQSPSITGLITQAGQLIGQQIGVSIGNIIGSTLEGVVTSYFPAPKAAGGS